MSADTTDPRDCPFCKIIERTAPAKFIDHWVNNVAIEPLNPVTPGHILVVPNAHVADFAEDSEVTESAVRCAAELAADIGGDFNLITSKGVNATQTVGHFHVHLVPRRAGDGLALPWSQPVRDITDPMPSQRAAAKALGDCWATHSETPGPDPECCIPAAVDAYAAAARPVYYREAAASLRVLLDGLLPIDDRTMGLRYAATRLERAAQDLEGDLDRAHNYGSRRDG